ncbi:DUF1273 domain-containing protein [Neobacillus vireti]|uniref:DUF1273 domain-containing protein n=1 Tax=Neobacillus vireti TaxID=220686 RepID=UPI002FFF2E8B
MLERLLISGYKSHELGIYKDNHQNVNYIKKAIEKELITLLDAGLNWAIVSGQSGVELWSAEVVLSLKRKYPHLKLAVITPFLGQEENWNSERQELYQKIIYQADFTTAISKQPYQGPWQFVQKNKFLIKNSDGLLILFDSDNENGSPKYLLREAEKFAQTTNYKIITITPYDLQMVVEEEEELKRSDFY